MLNENKQLIIKYFDEVWNKGKLDVLDEIIAPTYINHNPGTPNPIPGPEGLKPIVVEIRKAFPDLKFEIKNMLICNDQIAVHTIMRGTHNGDFFGLKPTNKVIEIAQMQIERIINNRIVEHWRVTDELLMLKQLSHSKQNKQKMNAK